MHETEALDIVSKMVLAKIKKRPSLTVRWGQLLKMLYEEYPDLTDPHMCSVCGESVSGKSGMCEDCEMLARQIR